MYIENVPCCILNNDSILNLPTNCIYILYRPGSAYCYFLCTKYALEQFKTVLEAIITIIKKSNFHK